MDSSDLLGRSDLLLFTEHRGTELILISVDIDSICSSAFLISLNEEYMLLLEQCFQNSGLFLSTPLKLYCLFDTESDIFLYSSR